MSRALFLLSYAAMLSAHFAERVGLAPTRPLPPLACFGTGAVGLSASRSSAESERFELPKRSSRPTPLPTVPLVPSGHSPCAEGERIERPQGSRPDLRLATVCLTSSASLPYAGRDLHPHAPSGTRASEARASAFRHQRLEWPTRFELALRPWQGRVLPLTLRPRGASGEIRTHDLRLTEAALCPLELQRQCSGSSPRTSVRRFQGPAGMPATHPEWSRLPVPTRVSCLTGAGSQPCATAGHRRNGAATRCRPGPSAVRRRSRSRARRRELGNQDSNLN